MYTALYTTSRRLVLTFFALLTVASAGILAGPAHAGLNLITTYDAGSGPVALDGTATNRSVFFANPAAPAPTAWGYPLTGGAAAENISTLSTHRAGDIGPLGGIATDPAGLYIYLAEVAGNRVLRYDRNAASTTDTIKYSAPHQMPGNGGLNYPSVGGVAAGSGSFQFDAPRGLDVEGGKLYVADSGNRRIAVIDALQLERGAFVQIAPEDGWPTAKPIDVAVDPQTSEIFVALDSAPQIDVFTAPEDQLPEPIVLPAPAVAVAVDPTRQVLYAATSDSIEVFDLETFAPLDSFTAPTAIDINDIEYDEATDALYVGSTSQLPAAYALDPAPTCNVAPVAAETGETVTIVPNCTAAGTQILTIVDPPANGSAIETDEGFEYTAADGPGVDSFSFTIKTASGESALYTQEILVTSPPAPPVKAAAAPAPEPVIRVSSNLHLASGEVFVRVPGSKFFVPLTSDMLVPMGTVVDATEGKADMTFANQDSSKYTGRFWAGIFQISQTEGEFPYAVVKLRDDVVGKAKTEPVVSSAAAQFGAWISAKKKKKAGKRKNRVWGDGKGRFRSDGSNSSASVRGTIWMVENYQNATRTYVRTGVVVVRDKRKRRNITLRRGDSYTAYR